MRLIGVDSLELVTFNDETKLPKYAILSHRWVEGEEVLYKDLLKLRNHHLSGWDKVESCCEQAKRDDIQYVWIDTCCIDKSSSAELSEAINSMYRWYANSEVCYAFLNDVLDEGNGQWTQSFIESAWFTRSWTLQELIAPTILIFYDQRWNRLGGRRSLSEEVAEASHIHLSALSNDSIKLDEWSIAQRMSWAARRNATRVEDVAYSLMGLFDVNMPLLYGEGIKAFQRLQQEILLQSNDQSIFAWYSERQETVTDHPVDTPYPYQGITGLLATSPSYFEGARDTVVKRFNPATTYAVTNLGLSITLPMNLWLPGCYWAGLNCTNNGRDQPGIWLAECPGESAQYQRITMTMPVKASERVSVWYNIISYRSTDLLFRNPQNLKFDMKTVFIRITTSTTNVPIPFTAEILPSIYLGEVRTHNHSKPDEPYIHHPYAQTRHRGEKIQSQMSDMGGHYPCMAAGPLSPGPLGIYARRIFSNWGNIVAALFGFDDTFRPFCILQTIPAGGQKPDSNVNANVIAGVEISNEASMSLEGKPFWQCTGLETEGWSEPSTTMAFQQKSSKSAPGVWALKGDGSLMCSFRLLLLSQRSSKWQSTTIEASFQRLDLRGHHHYKFSLVQKPLAEQRGRGLSTMNLNVHAAVQEIDIEESIDAISEQATVGSVSRGESFSSRLEKVYDLSVSLQALPIDSVTAALHRSSNQTWSSWLDHNLEGSEQQTIIPRETHHTSEPFVFPLCELEGSPGNKATKISRVSLTNQMRLLLNINKPSS